MPIMTTIAAAAALAAAHHTVELKDGRWTLVSPEGTRWWSLAPCCTNPGADWDSFQKDNPGYAGHRLFPTSKDWVLDTQTKLRDWGFNSLGGWSDAERFRKHGGEARLTYFVVLHLGAYYRAPWDDMFSKGFEKAASDAARDQISKIKDDPMLVGYFTDNELGWWDDTLFSHYLAMPPEAPGKKKIIETLKRHYRGSFAALRKDWSTDAGSFEELTRKGELKLKPGTSGMQAVNAWTKTLAAHYYSSVRRMVKKHDPHRLIMGDRYPQFWELPVVEASKPYVDVVSVNYGSDWLDGSLSRFFLDTLHEMTGKPVIIGEFYMNAMENNSGNRNTVKAFPIVQTQKQRADAVRRNLAELAERPYLLGAHWFQFYDHPPKGRGDGEDNNMGLVDTEGRPYPLLIDTFQKFQPLGAAVTAPTESNDIPLLESPGPEGLRDWPRRQGWVKPDQVKAFGDLYIAKFSAGLRLGVICSDYMDERLYKGGVIPEEDRAMIRVHLSGLSKPLEVRFGGKGRTAISSLGEIEVKEWPGLRHQLAVTVPWALVGSQSGPLTLKVEMSQHSRAAMMSWTTTREITR